MTDQELMHKVLSCAYQVHTILGPGLLESAYQTCMCHELKINGLAYEREGKIPIAYKGLVLNDQYYRADIIVEKRVVLELKAKEILLPVHKAQLITYLKIGGYDIGFLINFSVPRLKEGIQRIYPNKN
jgi:GxxExxY protein